MKVRWPKGQSSGFSLVEVLIAVVILGLGVTALLGAFGVAFSGSHSFRNQSDAKTVAISAAERVQSVAYVDCATTGDYLSTARLVGGEYPSDWGTQAEAQSRIIVQAVRYWNGAAFVDNATYSRTTCLANPSTYLKLQQIVIAATSPGDRATEVIAVVKRGPT